MKPSRTGSSGWAGNPGADGGARGTCGRLDRVPRYSPSVVAASTRSWVAPGVAEKAVALGCRTRRQTPSPASSAAPVSGSQGSASTGSNVGPSAARTPIPPWAEEPVAVVAGVGSPVPNSTTSSAASPPVKSTSRAPPLARLPFPCGLTDRVAHPPTGAHVAPASPVYQTPPLALTAYARRPSGDTAMSRMRPDARGRDMACPRRVTVGPIGTQRLRFCPGNARGAGPAPRRGAGSAGAA